MSPESGELDLGFARVDTARASRCGRAEVIFAPGKTPHQIAEIARILIEKSGGFLCTRTSQEQATHALCKLPDAEYFPDARILRQLPRRHKLSRRGGCAVISAGTADQAVAGEAFHSLEFFGWKAELVQDVGVAGIHRLFQRIDFIRSFDALIVVAGMEGALPSVVGGLVDRPLIAVPTSVGYGANFQGLSALLGMLNSCASGITVVNIDNGFGAACAVDSILRLAHPKSRPHSGS